MAATTTPVASVGTTLTVTPSGGTASVVGKLNSIGEITTDSEEIEVTTLDSTGGYREYVQGFRDSGTLDIGGYLTSGNAGQAQLSALYTSGAIAGFEVAFPDGTTCAFNGFVKSVSYGAAEVDGAVAFGAQIRISGAVTFTPAA